MNDLLIQKVDNLSDQVKELSEAITRLVRIEEKYISMEKDLNGFGTRMTKVEEIIQKLAIKTELTASRGDIVTRWVERLIFFIVIAALASFNLFKG